MHGRRGRSLWHNPVVMIVGLVLVIAGLFWPEIALLRQAYALRSWRMGLCVAGLLVVEITVLSVLASLWDRRSRRPRRD